ncbi:acyl-CoA carboxylase epsilon subunit [Streptomyces pseudogriseolus]|uniref:acyl-CoA carboxylase epsilon subunit n=1 Tax=Streptomyces pseudogriseolus TaxID=36817 RepID=UPI001CE32C74|nr:acyl-CoA carboxylase epsilon subunit [Streptomyces pseudogriseolus]
MGDSDRGALVGQGEFTLRIVRGRPGEADIAALLAVLLALRAGGAGADEQAGAPPDVAGWWRGPDAVRVPRGPR